MPPAVRWVAPSPAWLTQNRNFISSQVRSSHFRVWRGPGGGQHAEQTGPTAAHQLLCSDVRSRLFEQVHLREIGILLPNNQRQHRTLHIQKDVLPFALC